MRILETGYRPDIDGLRAIAILLVIFFHAFPNLITGGFVGVDVFFVISGYLITSIISSELAEGKFTYSSFYSRRVRRLFPTLLVVLVATIFVGWNVLSAEEYKQLARHVLAGLSFSANINLWSEAGYFDSSADSKPLLHLWSLGVEEQFYLVWPTLAVLLLPLLNRSKRAIAVTLASLIMVSALTAIWSTEAAFYMPFSRFWELFSGATVAVSMQRSAQNVSSKSSELIAVIGLLLIVLPAFLLTSQSTFPLPWAAAPVLGATILIVQRDSFINRVILSNRLLVGIGLVSYALYLWHWPLLSFIHIMDNGAASAWTRTAALMVAFVLATASYWLIEKPFRRKARHSIKLWTLGTVSVLTGLAATNIYSRDGLGFRVDSIISQVIGEKDPHKQAWRSGECFIDREGQDHFSPSCLGPNTRPDIFLWGDSHAAALYPGLAKLALNRGEAIAQYTAALCKPLLGDSSLSKVCQESNNQILRLISKYKPLVVVMHARWDPSQDPPLITQTIEKLRSAGVDRVVLVGPSPTWNDDLPRIVFNYYRKHHEVPPQLSVDCRLEQTQINDKIFSDLAKQLHTGYATFAGSLFTEKGCPLRTAPESKDIVMFDADHLTVAGSLFVGEYIWRQIIGWRDP